MAESRVEELLTAQGPVYIRNWSTPEFLGGLEMDEGLGVFWHFNITRAKTRLIQYAQAPWDDVVVAYTGGGLLAGYVIVSRTSRRGRWGRDSIVYELTLEVSRRWRQMGLATALLRKAIVDPHWQDKIFLAQGYSWDWDLEGTGLTAEEYRDVWQGMMAKLGFVEFSTDDPGILGDPYSLLMAWIGPQVPEDAVRRFKENLVLLG